MSDSNMINLDYHNEYVRKKQQEVSDLRARLEQAEKERKHLDKQIEFLSINCSIFNEGLKTLEAENASLKQKLEKVREYVHCMLCPADENKINKILDGTKQS